MQGFVWSAAACAALVVTVTACSFKPRAGGSCKPGQGTCVDAQNELECVGGKYAARACKGSGGCVAGRGTATCDDDIADDGDTCFVSESENWACSSDHLKAMICEDGKFKQHMACRGAKRCSIKHEQSKDVISCDYTQAQKGDMCSKPGLGACSLDYKQWLRCVNGTWDTFRVCRGPTGCSLTGVNHNDPSCDESVSAPGDPCGQPGVVACSTDQQSELRCTGGQYIKAKDCPKYGCHLTSAGHPTCD